MYQDIQGKHILIIGGNGAIGSAVVEQLLQNTKDVTIHATYHSEMSNNIQATNLHWHKFNVINEHEYEQLAQSMTHLDWIINCVGSLHTPTQMPEKNLTSVDVSYFHTLLTVNTLPSLLLAKHFTQILKRSSAPKLLTISARVGSIEDNRLGGWYSYRASKAALNMLLKNISIEWQRSLKNSVVIAFHPGTTDSHLSKPFQKNVPIGKLFTPQKVAHDLLHVLTTSSSDESGKFVDFNNEQIPW